MKQEQLAAWILDLEKAELHLTWSINIDWWAHIVVSCVLSGLHSVPTPWLQDNDSGNDGNSGVSP